MADNPAINVKHRIENKRTQRFVGRFFRRRNTRHNRFQYFLDPDADLGARFDCFLCRNRENLLELAFHGWHIRVGQIDLVNYRYNRQALFVGEMDIRHRLRFDPLCCIDNQQRAFARRERTRNFIGKIDVTRCVEQVQSINFT